MTRSVVEGARKSASEFATATIRRSEDQPLGSTTKLTTSLVLAAGVLEALYLQLRSYADLREQVPGTILLCLLSGVLYIISCRLTLTFSGDAMGRMRVSPIGIVLLGAILFRLTAWGIPPSLSDDVYRYRWEGRLQAAGGNPYQETLNGCQWLCSQPVGRGLKLPSYISSCLVSCSCGQMVAARALAGPAAGESTEDMAWQFGWMRCGCCCVRSSTGK